jgi:hypothetical protein
MLSGVFGPKSEEAAGTKKFQNEDELCNLESSLYILGSLNKRG